MQRRAGGFRDSRGERRPHGDPWPRYYWKADRTAGTNSTLCRDSIPLLYIYGADAQYLNSWSSQSALLSSPAFIAAERESYWAEVVDDQMLHVPTLDKCAQQSMLAEPISFHAPAGGLMFVQFVAADCAECERIQSAIEALITTQPQLPVRWLRISINPGVGTLTTVED